MEVADYNIQKMRENNELAVKLVDELESLRVENKKLKDLLNENEIPFCSECSEADGLLINYPDRDIHVKCQVKEWADCDPDNTGSKICLNSTMDLSDMCQECQYLTEPENRNPIFNKPTLAPQSAEGWARLQDRLDNM